MKHSSRECVTLVLTSQLVWFWRGDFLAVAEKVVPTSFSVGVGFRKRKKPLVSFSFFKKSAILVHLYGARSEIGAFVRSQI